ncbi:phage protease [Telmatospirillum sp. J64-1]|uniref:phage protease n=1 Tax=Telmatospirillum sp. J64-1 TaxID=2502183 RepID=UPI00115CC083|nr:phage protease [Telmatospirillum sp. J64-1]
MPKPIEIFAAGTHTAMAGQTLAFGEADLAATAAAYDPALHEAPLVVGHPRHDGPAYGWVKSLSAEGGKLSAEPDQIDPAFAELVAAGRFKKISAAFYHPDAKNNPKPGVYYLRHVGFLGAQPPAVKGLKPVEFAAGEDGIVEIEFGENSGAVRWALRSIADLFARLRDRLVEQDGAEEADKTISRWSIEDLQRLADQTADAAEPPAPAFSEPAPIVPAQTIPAQTIKEPEVTTPTPEDLAARQRQLEDQEAALRQRQAEFAEAEAKRKASDVIEGLIASGKVLPAEQDKLVAFMAALDEEGTVAFSEEGGAAVTKPLREVFTDFLSSLPKRVEFAELAPADQAPVLQGDAQAIANEAVAYQEEMRGKGVVITTVEAVRHVQQRKG